MRLADLTYEELSDTLSAITDELSDRLRREPKNHAEEFVAIKDLELSAGNLRTVFERSGKIEV